jgi:hypothetical protein
LTLATTNTSKKLLARGMPDAVMHVRGQTAVPINIGVVVELKRSGEVDRPAAIGQAAYYAERMLETSLPPSRLSMIAVVTDLNCIKVIRVQRAEAGGFQYQQSALLPNAREVLYGLMCSSPQQLGICLPQLAGPDGEQLQLLDWLGEGLTSEVYKGAFSSQVRSRQALLGGAYRSHLAGT